MAVRYTASYFLALFFLSFFAQAQTGTIRGVILDASDNSPLIGATVAVVNSSAGAVTDLDGKFQIGSLTPGTYTLKISYVGYASKELSNVNVISGQGANLNITLGVAPTNTLNEVVIQADVKKENINSMLISRKNAGVVSDAISADMIRKSPDKNTSEVLKRVSGITIQDNKFVVVRGMNDRYNEAMLNGSVLPSSEPDRKTFSFDIFPSSVVDNITILKSAAPDLPGDFSGGLIQINTRDIPDESFISVKAGASYNSITTFKDFSSYQGGKTDWLGIDDGTRNLPSSFPSNTLTTSQGVSAGQMLPNIWNYNIDKSSPLNPTFQVAGGFKLGKDDHPTFGAILGVTYTETRKFNPLVRIDYLSETGDTSYKYNDSLYNRNVLTSALANFAVKLNPNNKLYFDNLYSINSNDQTIIRGGYNNGNGEAALKSTAFFFASNQIYNGQLGGEHYIPSIKLRVKWLGYYTDYYRDEPDYRRLTYFSFDPGTPPNILLVSSATSVNVTSGVRYYATIKDHATGGKLDLGYSFKLFNQPQTFKFGGELYHDDRNRDARIFSNIISNTNFFNFNLYYAGPDTVFDHKHFDAKTGFILTEDNTPTNHYDGSVNNTSGYVMLDDKFTDKLRLVWGLRLESFRQILNTFTVDTKSPVHVDTTYTDPLPSANFIYSVLKDANIRLSYSRAVARPLYRELANQLFYDFLTNTTYIGNPALTETHINNYEVRWEQYFVNAQYYSISGFYKTFQNPIEQTLDISGSDSRTVKFVNVPKATNIGVELEGRKNLDFIGKGWENLIAYANVAFISSKVTNRGATSDTTNRPLQGQSPYIVNASLQYTEPKTNIGASILFNAIGRRIYLVGSVQEPVIWEKVHPTLDLKLSKSFLKEGLVELAWYDILHGDDIQYWDLNDNKKYDATKADRLIVRQKYGFNLSLSVSYKF